VYLRAQVLPKARVMVVQVGTGILIVQLLSEILPAGSLIRAQAAVRNPVLSATCRGGTVLLQVHQGSIRYPQKEVPEAAGVILLVSLQADLHIAEDLLQEVQEVHFLPDLLQVHPVDLHPLPILREAEGKTIDICFLLYSSFLSRSAGIVFQKMNIL
jgi:hypothetical protein